MPNKLTNRKVLLKKLLKGALCLAAIYYLLIFLHLPIIGTVHGPENDYITIGDSTYHRVAADFTFSDRGFYIGSVSGTPMRIFRVKGDWQGEYIYALWGFEGQFYVRRLPRE